ncbi:MAG: phospholipid/cholesterol/gamma-HCH transport system substrate-binding protein [Acidimicrobiaceae bacterium]|jgi:phospholipid/cholesterol/gamma-HCH transport system substrate-binding protein
MVALVVTGGCSLPGSKKGPLTITATFNDIGDLVENHAVQVADVRVGSISKIELTADFKAKVTMSIEDVHLPADAVAELRQTSLLGEKFVSLRACDPSPAHLDTGCQAGTATLGQKDHTDIPVTRTTEAPELEFVADQAIRLLGGVAANDLATLVQTGSVGFAGRGEELRGLIDDLAVVSSGLADQTANIQAIIDGLDQATSALAADSQGLDQLLVNLTNTTTVLANNRQQLIDTLQALTRLVQAQNDLVFDPYVQQVDLQIKQVDAILGKVTEGRQEVALLLDWINNFVYKVPQGIPHQFAQVYAWFAVCNPTDGSCG